MCNASAVALDPPRIFPDDQYWSLRVVPQAERMETQGLGKVSLRQLMLVPAQMAVEQERHGCGAGMVRKPEGGWVC